MEISMKNFKFIFQVSWCNCFYMCSDLGSIKLKNNSYEDMVFGTDPGLAYVEYGINRSAGEDLLTEEEYIDFMAPIWIVHATESTWKDELKEGFTGLSLAAITVFAPMVLGKVLEWAFEATTVAEMGNMAKIRHWLKEVFQQFQPVPLFPHVPGSKYTT